MQRKNTFNTAFKLAPRRTLIPVFNEICGSHLIDRCNACMICWQFTFVRWNSVSHVGYAVPHASGHLGISVREILREAIEGRHLIS